MCANKQVVFWLCEVGPSITIFPTPTASPDREAAAVARFRGYAKQPLRGRDAVEAAQKRVKELVQGLKDMNAAIMREAAERSVSVAPQ